MAPRPNSLIVGTARRCAYRAAPDSPSPSFMATYAGSASRISTFRGLATPLCGGTAVRPRITGHGRCQRRTSFLRRAGRGGPAPLAHRRLPIPVIRGHLGVVLHQRPEVVGLGDLERVRGAEANAKQVNELIEGQ